MFWLSELGEDLRYAGRQFGKEPGVTLVLLSPWLWASEPIPGCSAS